MFFADLWERHRRKLFAGNGSGNGVAHTSVRDFVESRLCLQGAGRRDLYRQREPEQTLLYQVLAEHLETFFARCAEGGLLLGLLTSCLLWRPRL